MNIHKTMQAKSEQHSRQPFMHYTQFVPLHFQSSLQTISLKSTSVRCFCFGPSSKSRGKNCEKYSAPWSYK